MSLAGLLAKAVNLYRGDFLEGFYVRRAPAFEEWVLGQRERLRELALQALHTLAAHHTAQGRYAAGIDYAQRLLALDPWREEAHRQMMTLLAHGGQRSAALAQYQTCRRILAEELGVEPTVETTALYERIRAAGLAWSHNLPAQPTPFFGREEELAEIMALLKNPDCRLLTIIGPGGIGKTRLALQAVEKSKAFLDGVYFRPLASVDSADFLAPTIVDALGVSFLGEATLKQQLLTHLSDKEMLLLLDNFEHLVEDAGLLVDILQAAPGVKLLVTSRERLSLHEEWLFEIGGLAFPAYETIRPDIETVPINIEQYSALQLFMQSARRVQRHFSPSDRELLYIVCICRLVGGLPLAIELASAWLRSMSCWEIVNEIGQNLDFLATSLRNVPERHRSLRAVFDHSWEMLSREEQQVFKKLSVFRGGFQPEAAGQVVGASRHLLSALVDKSFLRWDASGRYEVHELLRQYGAEKLNQTPRTEVKTKNLHCRYYMAFLQHRMPRLKGGDQQTALAEVGAEIENIRAGWQWVTAQKQCQVIDQALEGLYYFYETRGWFGEGNWVFGQASNCLAKMAKGTIKEKTRTRILGRVLARQGGCMGHLGLYEPARVVLHQSLDIFNRLDLPAEKAFPLHHLGYIAFLLGQYPEARQLLEDSIAIYRNSGDDWGVTTTLNILGDTAVAVGDYAAARQIFGESLTLSKAINLQEEEAWALHGLACVARAAGAYDEARQLCLDSLAIFEEINVLEGIAWSWHVLDNITHDMDDYRQAMAHYQQSLLAFKQIGEQGSIAETLNALGAAHLALGTHREARQTYYQSLQMAVQIQAVPVALYALTGYATTLIEANDDLECDNKQRALELVFFVLHHPARITKQKKEQNSFWRS